MNRDSGYKDVKEGESGEVFRFTALKLCLVLFSVYMLQLFAGFEPGFRAVDSPWWKFFTSFFGHSDLQHLMNNLFFIGLFGSVYEKLTSSRIFVLTFLLSAVFANISAFFFFPESFIIGASGGGMGLMAALALYRPETPGFALGVPLPMWAVLGVYAFINVAGLTGGGNVAYEAHLMGVVAGAYIGFSMRKAEEREEKYRRRGDDEEDLPDVDNWRERIREWERKYMLD